MKKKNEMSVGEAIESWLNEAGLKEQALIRRVIDDWPRIMGKAVAENTRRLWFRKGVFYVEMSHPVWKSELLHGKTRIRELLNKELGAQLIEEVEIF